MKIVTLNGAIKVPGEGNDYVMDEEGMPAFFIKVLDKDVLQVINLNAVELLGARREVYVWKGEWVPVPFEEVR